MSTPQNSGTPNAGSPAGHEFRMSRPVALADLTDDLLWPRLLRVPAMSLRPASITLAFFGLLVAGLLGELTRIWKPANSVTLTTNIAEESERAVRSFFTHLIDGLMTADPTQLRAAFGVLSGPPRAAWDMFGWGSLLALPMFGVLLIAGGAISRIGACLFAHGVRLSWVDALGFALRRWSSLFFAFAGPLLLVLFVYGVIALGGWALFTLEWTRPIGALLFPGALLGAALAIAILLLTVLGAPLLVPAVACEGSDAIEAMQRAFAYVPARPLRYAIYLGVLGAVGLLAVAFAFAVCAGTTSFASDAATAWVKQPPHALAERSVSEGGTAEWFLHLWLGLPLMIAASYAMSVLFTGCTVVYLLIRKLVDGQSTTDIWVPGLIPGTVAPSDPAAGAGPANPEVSRAITPE